MAAIQRTETDGYPKAGKRVLVWVPEKGWRTAIYENEGENLDGWWYVDGLRCLTRQVPFPRRVLTLWQELPPDPTDGN